MRLINTQTFQLQTFETSPPPYAILSHTWGPEEMTFEELPGCRQAEGPSGLHQDPDPADVRASAQARTASTTPGSTPAAASTSRAAPS